MGKSFCLSEFEKWTVHYFKFLLNEGKFGEPSAHQTPVKYFIDFYKKGLLIRITYYLNKDLIDIELFRNPEKIRIVPRNYAEHISLEGLSAYHGHPPGYYQESMPCRIRWQVSLKELAALFRNYAMEIVLGRKWVSVDMVCRGARSFDLEEEAKDYKDRIRFFPYTAPRGPHSYPLDAGSRSIYCRPLI